MLFRRRTPLSRGKRIKHTFWPEGGWRRALRYFVKRLLRLSGSPHVVAMGFAAGLFVAWSPLFGVHYLMAAGIAFVLGGNVLAAILSTTIGNPLTLPAMWALCFKVGEWILAIGGPPHHPPPGPPPEITEDLASKSWEAIWPIVKPIFVGSIPVGLVTGVVSYFIVRYAVASYQQGRRHRLQQRRMHMSAQTENS